LLPLLGCKPLPNRRHDILRHNGRVDLGVTRWHRLNRSVRAHVELPRKLLQVRIMEEREQLVGTADQLRSRDAHSVRKRDHGRQSQDFPKLVKVRPSVPTRHRWQGLAPMTKLLPTHAGEVTHLGRVEAHEPNRRDEPLHLSLRPD
jgi:hypothetical protein